MTTVTPLHIQTAIQTAEASLQPHFKNLAEREFAIQKRVLQAFQDHRISEHHLQGTSGYGHDDIGREALEALFAQIMGAEAGLVRPHIVSGTHAIAAALFGILRPADELLFVTGHPYDTLEEVIGIRGNGHMGSLKDWRVDYREVDVRDYPSPAQAPWSEWLKPQTRMVMIQRSRGYSWRRPIPVAEIGQMVQQIKTLRPDIVVMVDNCYGELVEVQEPCHVGADLIAGSLIKNPGGGIVPTGGYVCGRADLIEQVACRVYAPGIGRAGGATLDFNRVAFQGIFMAAHTVTQSLQGALLASDVFHQCGLDVSPGPLEARTDIIQAIRFGERQRLIDFCHGIQQSSPIDSYVQPIPYQVAGYADDVIMAAGTFAEGSSIELSADGPLREPFIGYLQGGLNYSHCKLALEKVLQALKLG